MRPIDKMICYKKIFSLVDDSKQPEKLFYRKDLQKAVEIEVLSDFFKDDFLEIKIEINDINLNNNILQLCRLVHTWFWQKNILVEQIQNTFKIDSKNIQKLYKKSNDIILDPLEMGWLSILLCINNLNTNVIITDSGLKNKTPENEFSRLPIQRTPPKDTNDRQEKDR